MGEVSQLVGMVALGLARKFVAVVMGAIVVGLVDLVLLTFANGFMGVVSSLGAIMGTY